MAQIGEHDPELGGHLDRAIHTGTRCAYRPDRDVAGWGL
jgi:monoamine oxidase